MRCSTNLEALNSTEASAVQCSSCYDKERDRGSRQRQKRVDSGLCVSCGADMGFSMDSSEGLLPAERSTSPHAPSVPAHWRLSQNMCDRSRKAPPKRTAGISSFFAIQFPLDPPHGSLWDQPSALDLSSCQFERRTMERAHERREALHASGNCIVSKALPALEVTRRCSEWQLQQYESLGDWRTWAAFSVDAPLEASREG